MEKPGDMYISEFAQVPGWVDIDITIEDVKAIIKSGCASGVYMPAVSYSQAKATMNKYGDAVLQYIVEGVGELPMPAKVCGWSQLAVFYLSTAVNLWAENFEPCLLTS